MTTHLKFSPCDLIQGLQLLPDAAALESATQAAIVVELPQPPALADIIDITQQGSTYYVSLNLDLFNTYSDEARAFLVWLYSRNSNETVHLTLINTCTMSELYGRILYMTGLFQALSDCKATTVGSVEGPVMALDAYVLMVCKKLIFGPYGVLVVQPLWSGSSSSRSEDGKVMSAFINKLYAQAVELQLLTEEEVTSLLDGRTVTLLPGHWAEAAFEHLTFAQEQRP